jgi:tetratricopeptide (TPR) repeat protein
MRICKLFKIITIGLLASAWQWPAQAQLTQFYTADDAPFRRGMELFDKQVYAHAQQQFRQYLALGVADERAIQAEYYAGLCAMYLDQPDFDHLLETFVAKYPTHLTALNAYYNIGDNYFKNGKYAEALPYLRRAHRPNGTSDRELEVAYKYGYALFQEKKYDEANRVLEPLKTGTSPYAAGANYYGGFIHYQDQQFAAAATDLERIKNHPQYGAEVDVLLPTAYYRQKRYDEVIAYAEDMLKNNRATSAELAPAIADSYYQKGNFAQSIQYFERYAKGQKSLDRYVAYRMGFAYARQKDLPKAINYFGKAADGADSLAQVAAYQMGVAYVEANQKNAAVAPFDKCRDLNFDRTLKELGAVNYAKLNYEIGDFKNAIAGCRFYDTHFPNGKFAEELNVLESEAYLNGNDYAAAIRYIEGLNSRSRRVQTGYQRVTFNYATELYNDGKYPAAVALLKKSLRAPIVPELEASALFWMAEAYSQGEKYDSALTYYERVPEAAKEYNAALYGAGYAYYNTKVYQAALSAFRAYVESPKTGTNRNKVDALTRLADCYYITRDFAQAQANYRRALDLGGGDAEYIYYQQGLTLGNLGQTDDANAAFDQLIRRFPNSRLTDRAHFQKGNNFYENDRKDLAATTYSELIDKFPNSEVLPDALSRRAQSYVLTGQEPQAIRDYKAVLDRYPTHPLAANAIQSLQELAGRGVAVADLEGYRQKFVRANPNSKATLLGDFNEAKVPYDNGDYKTAIVTLGNFIRSTPESEQRNDAYYFLGMAYEQTGDRANAVLNFDLVKSGANEARATLRAADLDYAQGNYQPAIGRYEGILSTATNNRIVTNAVEGLMLSHFKLGDLGKTEFYAGEIYKRNLTRAKSRADLYVGKVALERGQLDNALTLLRTAVKNNNDVNGAEAQYLVGLALRRKKEYANSTAELIKVRTNYEYFTEWLYEAFLLIADNYTDLDNKFQAKATLESIIENSKDPAVVARAREKLGKL